MDESESGEVRGPRGVVSGVFRTELRGVARGRVQEPV